MRFSSWKVLILLVLLLPVLMLGCTGSNRGEPNGVIDLIPLDADEPPVPTEVVGIILTQLAPTSTPELGDLDLMATPTQAPASNGADLPETGNTPGASPAPDRAGTPAATGVTIVTSVPPATGTLAGTSVAVITSIPMATSTLAGTAVAVVTSVPTTTATPGGTGVAVVTSVPTTTGAPGGAGPLCPQDEVTQEQLASTGQQIYAQVCSACHGLEGQGQATFPALEGSEVVSAGDPTAMIDIVLHGREQMPAFADQLSNEEIAGVITHERISFGDGASAVCPSDVQVQR